MATRPSPTCCSTTSRPTSARRCACSRSGASDRPRDCYVFDFPVVAGAILQPPEPPSPLMEKPFAPRIIGAPPRSLNREVGRGPWPNPACLPWPCRTSVPGRSRPVHGRDTRVPDAPPAGAAASEPAHLAAISTRRRWTTSLRPHRRGGEPVGEDLTRWPHEQPSGARRWRFSGLTDPAGLSNQVVVLADPDNSQISAGPSGLKRIRWAANFFLEVQFSTVTDRDAGTNAPVLLRPLGSLTANAFQSWRLAHGAVASRDRQSNPARELCVVPAAGSQGQSLGLSRSPRIPTKGVGGDAVLLPDPARVLLPEPLAGRHPPVGTITPYLRARNADGTTRVDPVYGNRLKPQAGDDNALFVHYRPVWPASAPVLQMAETLTLPKRGLPSVRGPDQPRSGVPAIPGGGDAAVSVTLHDPTWEKEFELGPPAGGTPGGHPGLREIKRFPRQGLFPEPPAAPERALLPRPEPRGERGAGFCRRVQGRALGEDYLC